MLYVYCKLIKNIYRHKHILSNTVNIDLFYLHETHILCSVSIAPN